MISSVGSSSLASYLQPMPRGGSSPKEMFSKLDSDGSGGLSSSELTTWASGMSAKTGSSLDISSALTDYDSDSNGELSEDEMQSFVTATLGPPPSQMSFGAFGGGDLATALDTDSSGSVSQSELETWAANMAEETGNTIDTTDAVSTYDADSDGELSNTELSSFLEASGAQGPPPPPPGGGMMGSGEESDSPSTTADSVISQYDTNGDGVLSSSELQAYLEETESGLFKSLMQQSISAYGASSESYNFMEAFSQQGQQSSGYSPVSVSA